MAAYLRIASIAIAVYDYLGTLPIAWRFYKEQINSRRLSVSAALFFLLRSMSIVVLALSNVGFFYGGFTKKTCTQFFLFPPTFKVLQAMVSQAILGMRAFNLSQRSRKIGWLLSVGYLVAIAFQWVTTTFQRRGVLHPFYHNCRAGSAHQHMGAWVYYAVSMIFDLLVTAISVIYLFKHKLLSSNSSVMSQFARMMLYDGLGYFVVLTAINVLNLLLYRSSQDIQTAAASLGYCVSWIMSQRLLLHLYNARERRNESIDAAITITEQINSARDVSRVVREQFGLKSGAPLELTVPASESDTISGMPDDIDVQVRIERTVRLEQRPRTFELEDYSRSGRVGREIRSHG